MPTDKMEVILAGYSLDHELVTAAKEGKLSSDAVLSPETLSAAYARISRYPDPAPQLRAKARSDVLASRKSNRVIVFDMGHHSVAEHVQLNFDILGLSRLAVEALQEARLCSYTEKSQRYITLEGDTVVPDEFGDRERDIFSQLTKRQVGLYKRALPTLHDYQKTLHPEMDKKHRDRDTVEGWAKEDARYALNLATQAQLGFSANARNLEHVIRKLRHNPLAEVRTLGARLYEVACQVVPSLIILSDPEKFRKAFGRDVSDDFLRLGHDDLVRASQQVLENTVLPENAVSPKRKGDVALIGHSDDPDVEVATSLLFSATDRPLHECRARAQTLRENDPARFRHFVLESLRRLTEFDPPPRAFESAQFTFQIELSSSAFAQLKRHRLATIIKQPYDPSLPCTFPESVVETGLKGEFESVFEQSNSAYELVAAEVGAAAAEYVLTNAHRRRVLFTCNLRELYHLARLRMDQHAQWDILNLSADMAGLVKQVAPVSAALVTGKDQFRALRNEVFSSGDI